MNLLSDHFYVFIRQITRYHPHKNRKIFSKETLNPTRVKFRLALNQHKKDQT